ncbi:hypothetical protein HW555_001742 [Spodoptera exigua]|uniref:Uncharacterized protein n=1 Tax=Spodoptera exigua TaxID=7107 RepID=A0A835GR50_SPOEX|nr:hypothetical protein HW555_001742 [Spodoptera exigua]
MNCVGSSACGFAAWALWDGRGNESSAARAGLLAVAAWGAALALGALAALCGAVRSSAPLLAAAFSLLALTAVAEAAAAWWGAAHRPELRRALHDALDHTVRHEYGVLPSRTQLLDVIQQGSGSSDVRALSVPCGVVAAGVLRRGGPARLAALGVGAGCGRRAARRRRRGRAGPVGGGARPLLLGAALLLRALSRCRGNVAVTCCSLN